jgi:hypothetical protein
MKWHYVFWTVAVFYGQLAAAYLFYAISRYWIKNGTLFAYTETQAWKKILAIFGVVAGLIFVGLFLFGGATAEPEWNKIAVMFLICIGPALLGVKAGRSEAKKRINTRHKIAPFLFVSFIVVQILC